MILLLLQTAIGGGVHVLPNIALQSGIVPFTFFIIFSGILIYYTLKILVWCSIKTNTHNYAHLVRFCYNKNAELLLNIIYISYIFLAIIGYQTSLSSFIPRLFEDFNLINPGDKYTELEKVIELLVINSIILPIALIRDLTNLRYFSLLGFIGVFYTT